MTLPTFDEELHAYLEALEEGSLLPDKPKVRIDVEGLRRHFSTRLRELKEKVWIERQHERWSDRIEDLARYIAELGHFQTSGKSEDAQAFARGVLDAATGLGNAEVPFITRLELERVARGFGGSGGVVRRYAVENGFTCREDGRRVTVTSLGRILLRLRGKNAVRLLLTVEVVGSRGYSDPWRIDRHLLERALEDGVTLQRAKEEGTTPPMAWAWTLGMGEPVPAVEQSLERLQSYSVLSTVVDELSEDVICYFVAEADRDLVRSVLKEGPWHVAVKALQEDERAFVVPAPRRGAAEAMIEQTRMIAHEVRNALGPVRYNVDELLQQVLKPEQGERVAAVKKGVVRVLDFVDQLVATSEVMSEPSTTFEVEGLLREVLGWVDGAENVQLDLPEEPLELRAPRPRLLRALLDVVRNALTSTTPAPRVQISVSRSGREMRIVVDDGGPGVPLELRSQVFDDGFTTRPGGSGFGLAFLRQVVERELHGKVTCGDAGLGGARFTIMIPDSKP